jgi:hypothetical protein
MSRGSDPLTIDKFRPMTAIIGVTAVRDFRPVPSRQMFQFSQIHKLGHPRNPSVRTQKHKRDHDA